MDKALMRDKGKAPEDERLDDLKQRLDEVAQRNDKAGPDPTDTMAAGFAMRAITEILVALAVCTIAGYYLDRYLGTTPWMMIILMPLGQAAGVWNVMRLSRSKQADAIMGKASDEPAKDLKDDDDED
jgi:ATP synthase protein I